MKNKTILASILAVSAIASLIGVQMVDSIQTNNLDRTCMTVAQSNTVTAFHKSPTYMPQGYSLECVSITDPFEVRMIATSSVEVPDKWYTTTFVEPQTILFLQIDEKDMLGEERFAEELPAEQRIREDISGILEENSKMSPAYININGVPGFITEECKDCGKQTAKFADGTVIEDSFAVPSRLKLVSDDGLITVLSGYVSTDELVKIAKNLQ